MIKDITPDVLDSNYPLMVRLREKAPGTYSHSKAVASLLESVATVTDLPEKELAVAGYYHDIGKTVNPHMFSENQAGDAVDAYSELPPWASLRFITAHVGDTAQILINDPNISHDIVRWCTQHHGACVAKYFYRLAKKEDKNTEEDDYRYPGTKPECLEAALLMICDILEATSRSLSQAGKLGDVGQLVEQVIQDLEQDQQLDDVELTFGKLRIIKEVLKKELTAQYHQRVDYDNADKVTPEEEVEK